VRELLAMSQVAFAALLGADPSTVRSWEQGLRTPNPLACRLLSEIEADPSHWRKRIASLLVPAGAGAAGGSKRHDRDNRPGRAVGDPV
jgi:hypothetical protein